MTIHCKKWVVIFPLPAGMTLTKLSLAGNNQNIFTARENLVSDIPPGDGKIATLFYSVCFRNFTENRLSVKVFKK
jgi:hypothetical protein